VARGIDQAAARALAGRLAECGVVSVAICLLNSFRNPVNEAALGAILKDCLPDLHVSLSSSVAPQIREYPRASTTAVNAYTAPITQPYLDGLAQILAGLGVAHSPLIMLSSGGVIAAPIAARNPVRMIESGPAAGALAAAYYAQRLGLDRLLSFDMGGTTAKACLIENRTPLVASSLEVDRIYRFAEGSGIPLTIPSIDMIEIGAGGGSIASMDALGLLKIGPQSAGSVPGPACYGRGGARPTVTDADLALGLLDGANFLGGDMKLDLAAAQAAIGRLGDQLGTSMIRTAAGMYQIVAETMAAAARTHATDRGVDHRGLKLLAFGGAGPVHACAVGTLLQSRAVIFPPRASVLSAFGTLVTPPRFDLVRSAPARLDALDWAQADSLLDSMLAEGSAALRHSAGGRGFETVFGADLRYFGQQNELTISLPEDPRATRDIARIKQIFEAAYLAQYGVNPGHVPIELVAWRLCVRGAAESFEVASQLPPGIGSPKSRRMIHLWPQYGPTDIYDRASLAASQAIIGPAIIEERETTIVVPPGWSATVDGLGCIVAERKENTLF
jgi:N-methylhydantoinase A